MSNKTAFDVIQTQLLQLDLDSMIGLFNDCSKILGNLRKEYPEVRKQTDFIFQQTICKPNKDVISFMDLIFKTYDIDTSNFLIQAIQKGGVIIEEIDDEGELVPSPPTTTQSANDMTTRQQNSNTMTISQQQLGASPISYIAQFANLTPEAQMAAMKLVEKQLEIVEKQVDTKNFIELQESNREQAEHRFLQIIRYGNIIVPFGAPAFICYYLQSVIENSALKIISNSGSGLANLVGGSELLVRNTILTNVGNGFSWFLKTAGRGVESVWGEKIFPDMVRGLASATQGEYVEQSTTGTLLESASQGAVDVTRDTVCLANVCVYILAALLLYFVCLLLTSLMTGGIKVGALGFYLELSGVRRRRNVGGKKTRKNIKNRKNKKTKRKY